MKNLLNQAEIHLRLKDLNQSQQASWNIDKSCLHSQWHFQSFEQAIEFINAAALLAHAMDHHPELRNTHNKVSVSLTTHDANGLTMLDFAMARELQVTAAQLMQGIEKNEINTELPSKFIGNWLQAFNNEDLQAITSCYDNKALLWGTRECQPIKGQEGIQQYFKAVFDSGRHIRASLISQESMDHRFCRIAHGSYFFTTESETGPVRVDARFSFVWRPDKDDGKILSHHSSIMPLPA